MTSKDKDSLRGHLPGELHFGADGKSAYQLAVENGYEGTVLDWLDSLHGPPGTPDPEQITEDVNAYLEKHPPAPGADGGYYTPAVTQPTEDTIQFDFTPSKAGMPSVEPVQVKLPAGAGSGGNVDLSGYVQSVNGVAPDKNGNVEIAVSGGTAAAIDYDKNVHSVNHRGYSATAPENTIPAYILSKKNGFTYVEADVSFTSDGVAVLLHDATIDRTSDGSGTISEMTYADVLAFDFGRWKSSAYTGTKIATFEEFIILCKRIGLHPYIELKDNGDYTEEQIQALVATVKACGMAEKVTWISFSNTFLGYVKNVDSAARLGYLSSGNVSATLISKAQALQTDENEVFLDTKYSNLTDDGVQLCIDAGIPLEVWTVNTDSAVLELHSYITGVTSDSVIAGKTLYDAGMVYNAPETPEVPATAITLSASELTFDSTESQTLTATVEPSNTTDPVEWTSTDNGVASVNNGVVTPVSSGTTTIRATAGSVSAECAVNVNIEVVTYTVENNLTNVSNSNSATAVTENSTYSANLTAADGYNLDSVAVTMGGADITATAYADGVVSIAAVTGNVVITATAIEIPAGEPTLLYDWDLTSGLTDSVSGATFESSGVTQDENGLHFDDVADYIKIADVNKDGYTIEVDVGRYDRQGTSHGRLIILSVSGVASSGFIYRSTDVWSVYSKVSGAWYDTTITDPAYFDGKTVTVKFGYNESDVYTMYVYDGEILLASGAVKTNVGYVYIGSDNGQTAINMTVTGIRVYQDAT